jgi:hypothetical protein
MQHVSWYAKDIEGKVPKFEGTDRGPGAGLRSRTKFLLKRVLAQRSWQFHAAEPKHQSRETTTIEKGKEGMLEMLNHWNEELGVFESEIWVDEFVEKNDPYFAAEFNKIIFVTQLLIDCARQMPPMQSIIHGDTCRSIGQALEANWRRFEQWMSDNSSGRKQFNKLTKRWYFLL